MGGNKKLLDEEQDRTAAEIHRREQERDVDRSVPFDDPRKREVPASTLQVDQFEAEIRLRDEAIKRLNYSMSQQEGITAGAFAQRDKACAEAMHLREQIAQMRANHTPESPIHAPDADIEHTKLDLVQASRTRWREVCKALMYQLDRADEILDLEVD